MTPKDQASSSAATGVADGLFETLRESDQTSFAEILRATPNSYETEQDTVYGHPYFISAFTILDGTHLHLKENPEGALANALEAVSDPSTYSSRGTLTNDHLILCFGLADWSGKMMVLPNAAFDAFLTREWPDIAIRPSEVRMLRQLLIGQSPKDAAKADGIGYETKRTYVKNLCQQFNLAGQVELVAAVLGRLLLSINSARTSPRGVTSQDALNDYQRFHLPGAARILRLMDEKDRVVPIIDLGAQAGRPIVLAHQTIPPFFSESIQDSLRALNLRVLVPLRPGILDPNATVLPADEFAAQSLERLALCKSILAGPDAPVLGISKGGSWAIKFAQTYPDLTPKLFLASVSFHLPHKSSLLGRLSHGWAEQLRRRPAIISLYVDFLLWRNRDPVQFRATSDRFFPPDTLEGRTLAWEFSQTGALEAWMHLYQSSPAYLKMEGYGEFYPAPSDIANLDCPVHMLHGTENTRYSIDAMRKLVSEAPNAHLTEREGAGYALRGADLDAVWEMIAGGN